MNTIAVALIVWLFQDPSIDDLIRRLDSDSLQEREDAQRKIRARGRDALPQLEKASQGAAPEVASRAKRLVELVKISEREQLTPDILTELPGLDEKLLSLGDQAWVQVFLDRAPAGAKALKTSTWAFLAPRATRNAKTVENRAKIVEALVQVPIPEAAPELVSYFLNPLTEFRDPEEILRSSLKVMTVVKATRELLRVVVEYGDYRSERRHANPNIVSDAFVALRDLQARPEILVIAQAEASFTAGEAVQALAAMEHPDTARDLLKILSSKNVWARHHAALSLGKLGIREARPGLTALLTEPDGPTIRASLDALARLGVREEIPRMLPFLSEARSWVQVAALRSLAALDAKEALPTIRDLLTHHEPAVRAIAGESLARLLSKEAVPELLPLLQDKDAGVRLYGALALGDAGSIKGLPVLLRMVEAKETPFVGVSDLMSAGSLEVPPLPLLRLNGLRSPETWNRLLKISVLDGLQGTVLPDTDLIAGLLGLKVDWSPELSHLTGLSERRYYYDAVPKSKRLADLLNSYCFGDLQFVFDGPTLRVLTRTEAVSEWKRWYIAREPADADAAAFRKDLVRMALPEKERVALETREREEAKNRHRKERAKALDGLLTPGLKPLEDRLLDGDEGTWAQIALEYAAKPEKATSLDPDARDVLVSRALATVKPEDRSKVLGLAAVVRSTEIPDWIGQLLQDADGAVRWGAVKLLDPKKHLDEIRKLAGDPGPGVRSIVADALLERYPQEAIEILKDLSLQPDWQTCDRATMMLSYRAGPDLIPHMIGQLKRSTSNFSAALSALRYLGRQGAREAIPAILPLLEEERGHCGQEALRTLLDLGARESMPRILRAMRRNPNSGFQTVHLIEAFQVQEALPDLYVALGSEHDYSKEPVMLALARMGKVDALSSIRKLLRHEYTGLRVSACDALTMLEGEAARSAVLDAFRDPAVLPLNALVRLNARDAVPELSKRLRNYQPGLIEALVDLDGHETLPRIFAILDKPSPTVYFSEGLKAVARAYPKESIPTLRTNLTSDNPDNRSTAAAMLCETGSGEGVPILIENKVPAFSLNAIRRPEAWRALHNLRFDETLFGTGPELLERIALKAGLKVERFPADAIDIKAWTGHYYFLPKGARPLRATEVIDRLEDQRWAFILENDTLRVVPRDAALTFWKEWSGTAPKK